jgi:hypothetical protein
MGLARTPRAVPLGECRSWHRASDARHRGFRSRETVPPRSAAACSRGGTIAGLAAGGAPRATAYEVTLERASLPGLPVPVMLSKQGASPASAEEVAQSDLSRADRVVLDEGTRILADYVELVAQSAERADRAAAPREWGASSRRSLDVAGVARRASR